jgi:Na+/H+-dicarboxylate symporter
MGRTALNVFGNTVAVKLVQKLGGLGATDTPDTISVGPALENGAVTATTL